MAEHGKVSSFLTCCQAKGWAVAMAARYRRGHPLRAHACASTYLKKEIVINLKSEAGRMMYEAGEPGRGAEIQCIIRCPLQTPAFIDQTSTPQARTYGAEMRREYHIVLAVRHEQNNNHIHAHGCGHFIGIRVGRRISPAGRWPGPRRPACRSGCGWPGCPSGPAGGRGACAGWRHRSSCGPRRCGSAGTGA